MTYITFVYCGHEYTESNLKFAMAVEPDNQDILKSTKQVQKARSMNKPSLPSQIDTEFKINPFMRCREISVINAAEKYSKIDAEIDTSQTRIWGGF